MRATILLCLSLILATSLANASSLSGKKTEPGSLQSKVSPDDSQIYVDEKEFEQILKNLRHESENSLDSSGDNYVADEDLDAILPLLSNEVSGRDTPKELEKPTTRAPTRELADEPDELDMLAPEQTEVHPQPEPDAIWFNHPKCVPAKDTAKSPSSVESEFISDDSRAYVPDSQFDEVLAKLRKEAELDSFNDPDNYVSEEELQMILSQLEQPVAEMKGSEEAKAEEGAMKNEDKQEAEESAKDEDNQKVEESPEQKVEGQANASEPERSEKSESCTLCNSRIQGEETLNAPGCEHVFHRRCLEGWFRHQKFVLRTAASCPTCNEGFPRKASQ